MSIRLTDRLARPLALAELSSARSYGPSCLVDSTEGVKLCSVTGPSITSLQPRGIKERHPQLDRVWPSSRSPRQEGVLEFRREV